MIIGDVILLILLFGFVFYGLFFGLIRTIGSVVGIIIGLWGAAMFYSFIYSLIQPFFFGLNNIGKVFCFLLLFVVIKRLIFIIFIFLDQAFSVFLALPFIRALNKFSGAALGFVEGALILGIFFHFITDFLLYEIIMAQWLSDSSLVPFFIKFADLFMPMITFGFEKIKGAM